MKNGQYRDVGNIGYVTWTPPKPVNFVDIGGIVDHHSRNYRSSGDPKCYSMYYTNFGLTYGA